MLRASPFRHWHSASIASSSSGVWVRVFLSRTLGLPGQRGGIIIRQNDQVQCGFTFATLGLWLVRLVGKGFIIRLIGRTMFFPEFVPVF